MPENTTATTTQSSQWTHLLSEVVSRPGLMLAAYHAFWNYSTGNQIAALIQCQQRGLTPGPLATFPAWKDKGRHVRKGERALVLCMPITVKGRADADPDARYTSFVYKPRWFVLSQTDGEPVAALEPPTWSYAQALAALHISEIPFDHTDGNTQGFARGRELAINPLAEMPHKTRFHELAHITLGHTAEGQIHDDERTPRSLREAEAEAVALLCCETLELPGADYCRGYIQHWLSGAQIPERSAQKIFHAANTIIKAGQPQTGAPAHV
jgi:N-terminal domain of anti-restriction factor ArdC